MIKIKEVTKIFKAKKKKIVAVDNLTLQIKKGETFGLIGPTGAGKTTILKMISTIVYPDKGEILVNGKDVIKEGNKIKEEIGVLVGEFMRGLYWRLTGWQNLEFFATLKGLGRDKKKIKEIVDLFSMEKWVNTPVMYYSTGMKHKLAFAIALLNDPPILLLDEPLTGIDPLSAYEIKEIVKKNFRDKTIIWTSHNLDEIEKVCDRVGILNKGKLIFDGSIDKAKKSIKQDKIVLKVDKPYLFINIGLKIHYMGNMIEIKTDNILYTLQKIIEFCQHHNIHLEEIHTPHPSLEEVFIERIKDDKG